MSDENYALLMFIIIWGIVRLIDSYKIDKLDDRIKDLKKEIGDLKKEDNNADSD